jgi:hypothetical protein
MINIVQKTLACALAMLFALSTFVPLQAIANDTEEEEIAELHEKATTYVSKGQWDAFSENLVVALKSEHDGLKVAAMGMVIRYSDQVDVKNAVFDVMRVYRNHDNMDMRRMALVTLGEMNNEWAIAFLERAERFEDSPVLRQTIKAVVAEYHATHVG